MPIWSGEAILLLQKHTKAAESESIFIGSYPNRRIQKGCFMKILWDKLHPRLKNQDGGAASWTRRAPRLHSICSRIPNADATMWVVHFWGLSPDTAHLLLMVDDTAMKKSRSLICQESLLMADLELAYGSFCRMNKVKMAHCGRDPAHSFGGRVIEASVSITEGLSA